MITYPTFVEAIDGRDLDELAHAAGVPVATIEAIAAGGVAAPRADRARLARALHRRERALFRAVQRAARCRPRGRPRRRAVAVRHRSRDAAHLRLATPGRGMSAVPVRTWTERELQDNTTTIARSYGWLAVHFGGDQHRRAHYDATGFPDLFLLHVEPSAIMFRELKSRTGKLTPAQDRWQERLKLAGFDVEVWRPEDWPEIVRVCCRSAPPRSRAMAAAVFVIITVCAGALIWVAAADELNRRAERRADAERRAIRRELDRWPR